MNGWVLLYNHADMQVRMVRQRRSVDRHRQGTQTVREIMVGCGEGGTLEVRGLGGAEVGSVRGIVEWGGQG